MQPADFGLQERKKLIHSVSANGRFALKTVPNPWTGIFSSGTGNETDGIIRFSASAEPTASGNFGPGVSLKILRDGVSSANFLAMFSLTGQPSFNFFENTLSNHPPAFDPSKAPPDQGSVFKAFNKVSAFPTMLGVSSMAQYDAYGAKPAAVNFPFRVDLVPRPEVKTLFPSSAPSPFNSDFYLPQLTSLKPGTVVYDVVGIVEPTFPEKNEKSLPIGTITLTSPIVTSDFSDKHLFFAHSLMEDDLKLKPSWSAVTSQIFKWERTNFPPVRS
jgi:hypothetical protein